MEENTQITEELDKLRKMVELIRNNIQNVLIGQDELIDFFVVAILTKGHILLEGVPGIAKTLASKLFAKTLSVGYARIQFTPDLMPADVLGTSIFNLKTSEFNFNKGPIFSNIVLIDEINRAPAKTQSALFEVMEERQVTEDGVTYPMSYPFMIISTQNPVEQEGTYKLPEAQLDRFLFKIKLHYPSLEDEKKILRRFRDSFGNHHVEDVQAIIGADEVRQFSQLVEKIHIKDEILDYIAAIIDNTRNNGDLFLGASPRASLALSRASKALAAIRGRDFVTPDDVKYLLNPILNHRIVLNPDKELEGIEPEDIIEEISQKVEIPR